MLLLFSISSCITINHRSFVAKPTKNLISNNLVEKNMSIEGVYYRIYKQERYGGTDNCMDYFIFYNNLSVTDGRICREEALSNAPDSIVKYINRTVESRYKNGGNEFGGFAISEGKINIQVMRYVPQFHWAPATYLGEIADNNTLHISKFEFPDREINKEVNEYYHFISMKKPDSIKYNRWSNKKWYWKD